MSKLGIKTGQDRLVGVYAKNMVERIVPERALTFYNMILIPFYNTLGDQAMRYITKQTEIEGHVLKKLPTTTLKNSNTFLEIFH